MNKKIVDYYKWLSLQNIELFDKYKIVNPYKQERIMKIVELFYNIYFEDNHNRYLILGASPARRGTSATGIPFEDEECEEISQRSQKFSEAVKRGKNFDSSFRYTMDINVEKYI